METSSYQLLKIYILSYLPITKDAVHVYVGIIGLLLMVLIVRSPINSLKTLAPIFALSFVMEAFDL